MKTDTQGCSTCPKGQESYESFFIGRQERIQYDYRTAWGKLFSCVAKTLEEARAKRDAWLRLEVERIRMERNEA